MVMSSDPDRKFPIDNEVAFSFVVKLSPSLLKRPPQAARLSSTDGDKVSGVSSLSFVFPIASLLVSKS